MDQAPSPSLLLHITTATPWRVALSLGTLVPPSLVTPPDATEGFVHLSTKEQVHLPANRLFAGRDDLLLLVVDPARLPDPIRWEPGVPGDPESMRFPHLYGPLPTAAVTSVLPWRPGPEGTFTAPIGLPAPADRPARAAAFSRSLTDRRAAARVAVDGGIAFLDPRVPASHEHNALWLDRPLAASEVRAVADAALGARSHRYVYSSRPLPTDLGWRTVENRLMILDDRAALPEPDRRVVGSTSEAMEALWEPKWRHDHPGLSDEAIADLLRREPIDDAHVRVTHLAVLDDTATPIAGARLHVDGATAEITGVQTHPEHRGRGHARAAVLAAARRARAAGCDVVWLHAVADDWPRRWYERLGFVDVGALWTATRSG